MSIHLPSKNRIVRSAIGTNPENNPATKLLLQEKILAARLIFQEIILTKCFCTCGERTIELQVSKILELLGNDGALWPEEVGFTKFDLMAYDYFLQTSSK